MTGTGSTSFVFVVHPREMTDASQRSTAPKALI
jgi:hypothetical protein